MQIHVLKEKTVLEGAQAFKAGNQRWAAWNALLRNHVQHGRMTEEEHEAYVAAALAELRKQNQAWLGPPDIW